SRWHVTPLGRALREVHAAYYDGLTRDQLKEMVQSGKQILADKTYPGVKEDKAHLFHAGLDEHGDIVALSDNGKPKIAYGEDERIFVVALTPKETVRERKRATSGRFFTKFFRRPAYA